MFNTFVVNDWNVIANVYLHADRFSSPYIVYSFFIGANLVGVSILINVLTAYFVGAFVTKIESNNDAKRKSGATKMRLQMASGTNSQSNSDFSHIECDDLCNTTRSAFRVFQRQDYIDVMKTVTGDNDAINIAKKARDVLELFERLSPATQEVGHLIRCQQSQDYFANKHFLSMVNIYINEGEIHRIIGEMFSELVAYPSAEPMENRSSCCLQRFFLHYANERKLVLSASLLSSSPPVGLFVVRVT